ncbi:hypothetical protein [Streptomyces adustus]|uniref:hypothetical protein n=1 Tax=Streptomyces adustus TaxID=1609272 RepID=UPI0012E0A432|nr:hypothetical protein [Streptomyces adustus]
MRFAPVAAASVIALGALVGGITTSSDTAAPAPAQQRTVALASSADLLPLSGTDNNGNG